MLKVFANGTSIYVIIEDEYEGANTLYLNIHKVHH